MIDVKPIVFCDFDGCREYLEGDYGDTIERLMTDALRRGWIFSYKSYVWAYCPKHKYIIDDSQIFKARKGKQND